MVVWSINVEGMLEDSQVIGVISRRQEILSLEVVDRRKPAQFGLGARFVENDGMFF